MAEIVKQRCEAMVSVSGEWERCARSARIGTAGWTSTRIGFYCPRHAPVAKRLLSGRGA